MRTNGVKLRSFQSWFHQYDDDLAKIRRPKSEKKRHQNKVEFQAARTRLTVKQKLPLIAQYEAAKEADDSHTIKSFCDSKPNLKEKTFTPWLRPIEKKRIEIDAKLSQLKNSRWSSNGSQIKILFKRIYYLLEMNLHLS